MAEVDNRDRLGVLVSRALGQGFELVQVDLAARKLRAGYPGELALELALDLERMATGELKYLGELLAAVGRVSEPPVEVGLPWPDGVAIERLAAEYLRVAKLVDELDARLDGLKKELVERMPAQGRAAIDVAGAGAVVYVPAGTRQDVDRAAVKEKLGEVPYRRLPVAAHLKTVWAQG